MASIDLSFSYDDGKAVFSSLSIDIEEGEHLLVLAPPESGKTTLSRIITGSVPKYRPGTLHGHFDIDGVDVLSLDTPERLKLVGRISQDTDEMILFSSVEEEISFPLENLGLGREEREERIIQSLSLFGLESYREVSTSELSGGEKRRLMLAILFAIDPEVYIFDESFDELSPEWRRKLSFLIKSLERKVIAFASHQLPELGDTFDRTLSIKDGKASEHIPEKPLFPPFSFTKGDSVLTAESLVVEREHRSSSLLSQFSLEIPSFSLHKGELLTLLGDNGSGKSTFSRTLSGLLKERSGSVLLDGRPLSAKERRHTVAYLMQNPYEELFLPTVGDELRSTGKENIGDVLSLFGLDENDYVQEMSYGKAKLLQAAIFYLLKRPFAIFDELDSAIPYEDFSRALSAYLDSSIGVVVITHDTNVTSMLPGRKLMIEEGTLHEC